MFPAVALARQAGETGGCLTAVYNAANEEAAEAFLAGRIGFPAIVRTVADVLSAADQWAAEPATVEDVLDAQRWARAEAGADWARHTEVLPTGDVRCGIVLFALGILISVALHECGHMWVAQGTGMKVRRYFVGFGPTLWSTRRGETEYGLKAIPAGGFCDIAGMTAVEELRPTKTTARCTGRRPGSGSPCCSPAGDELRHRLRADLRHRARLGAAQPASHRGHRSNRLCGRRNQARRLREVHR